MSQTSTDVDSIADDMLRGVPRIAPYIGETERRTFYLLEKGRLPAFKVGSIWHMRKSTYRSSIARLEAEAMAKVAA